MGTNTNLSITTSGTVTGRSGDGIGAGQESSGTTTIEATGDVNSDLSLGIYVDGGDGDVSITTSGAIQGGLAGIGLETNAGNADVTIAGAVTTTRSGGNAADQFAIDLRAITGNSRLELQPGFALSGETQANAAGDNRLVFGGPAGTTTIDLADWDDGSGAPDQTGNELFGFAPILLKEDASTFILTGTPGASPDFTAATITGGTLVLDAAAITMATGATPFLIEANGTLGIRGRGHLTGDLTNCGTITLQDGAADDVLTVSGNYVGDGGRLLVVHQSGRSAGGAKQCLRPDHVAGRRAGQRTKHRYQ